MKRSLQVLNGDTARFQCVWPSCGGGCCKESRPPVSAGEAEKIDRHLTRFLPLLRPSARRVIEQRGWLTRRKKGGRPTIAISDRYCVFYNEGCALHRVGAEEGDKNRYKPSTCITFPLDRSDEQRWYVRQWGIENEEWDLPCLSPQASPERAIDMLQEEVEFAERLDGPTERWRRE